MADVYTVKSKSISVYEKSDASSKKVSTLKKGAEVKIYSQTNVYGMKWGNTTAKGGKWVNMSFLKKVSSGSKTKKSSSSNKTKTIAKENTEKADDDTIYGDTESSYNALMLRYIRAFGSPPKYTKEVDPYYTTDTQGIYTGRAMSMTWFSNPSILSLCPGTVDYLPGFGTKSKKNKEKFFNMIKGSMSGTVLQLAKKDSKVDLNGKLYAFKSAYKDYMNIVNLLARTAANYLGIGDVSNMYHGTNVPLKKFDYGYFTTPNKIKGNSNIFAETKNALNSVVTDNSYIHFFVNNAGVSMSDSFSTSSGQSYLEQKLGGDGTLSQTAQNLQFLFGGAITDDAKGDLEGIIQQASDSNALMGGFARISSNYLKGGRLVFPQMITGMDYQKTISVELGFSSVYGDKRSIFKQTILPALHLIAMATPKQLSDNMYTYPFLVRAYDQGNMSTDLAFISSLELTRGGSDNTSWTVDGLPTEITARMQITPLYSNMMVTSSRNPFLFMNNTALMEYLGVMCGLDLKVNNLDRKVQLAKDMLKNYIHDTPTSLARGVTDSKIVREARKFFQILE